MASLEKAAEEKRLDKFPEIGKGCAEMFWLRIESAAPPIMTASRGRMFVSLTTGNGLHGISTSK